MYGSFCDSGRFMKNFVSILFATLLSNHGNSRDNFPCGFIGKSDVIKISSIAVNNYY